MKHIKFKNNLRAKREFIKCFAILMILSGLGFSFFYMMKYWVGYNAYQTGFQPNTTTISEPTNETVKAGSYLSRDLAALNTDNSTMYSTQPIDGEKFGELSIPKLKAILPIYQGTNDNELEKGVGHYTKSVLPGEKDNCVLSGHRDTVFRKLGDVGVGDLLVVTTSAGEFTYKVRKVRIVDADDRTVIVPKPRAVLTVTTCYPFDFIGSSPKRYILVAYLTSQRLSR